MLPFEPTSMASVSSLLLSANPRFAPLKYNAQVPLVVGPNAVGVNANTSSSLTLLTPVTDGLPVVEIRIRPSGSLSMASMSSPEVVNPTSLPWKYMLNVPDVLFGQYVSTWN